MRISFTVASFSKGEDEKPNKTTGTMGSCLTKTAGRSPECRHERLNEHSDKYFQNVEARNSVGPRKRWWQRLVQGKSEGPQLDENPSPTMTEPCATSEPEADSSFETTPPVEHHEEEDTAMSPSKTKTRKRVKADAEVDGWQVKSKGNALKLRLAKNRFLQLAATSGIVSPITLDSGAKSNSKSFNPLESSMVEDLNLDFDDSMCTGIIWIEVARTVNVSAVAMSRTATTKDSKVSLLLAVGGENGMVTVTDIVDESLPVDKPGQEDQLSVVTPPRKFGETLEFQTEGRVRSIDFSPNGNYMVIGGDCCVATVVKIVLDPMTGALQDLQALQQVERVDRIYSVLFDPDSASLAIAGFDGKVALVDLDTLLAQDSEISPVEISRPGLILCLDWSPDGSCLAIGGSDKTCAIVDSSYNLVHETSRSTAIQTMKWNHDGAYLALGDREVAILEAGTFEVKCEISYTPSSPGAGSPRYRVSSLCWSPDGSFLAVGGSDGICLVIETNGYALVHEINRAGNIASLAWGQLRIPSGELRRYLAISDESCNVALLKAGSENEGSVSESDDLSSTASSSYFSAASDWVLREDCFRDIEDSTPSLPAGTRPQGNVTAVAFSRSKKSKQSSYLAYAADDCSLTIMTTRDWKPVFQMEFAKPIRSLMFSSSSNFLALGGDEGVLYVLSVPSRSIVFNTIFTDQIRSICFSRHDERLAVGVDDGVLSLLCPDAEWEPAGEIETSDSPILAQDWCSKHMAIGRLDGTVAIFDTEKALSNFFVPQAEYSHALPVRSVAFGASGRFLVVGGGGGLVSILSAKGGWVLCNQIKLGCSIWSTRWSPGGRYLAFAGSNKTFRVMDTISWVEVMEVRDAITSALESQSVQSLCSIDWSVDGQWVAVGSTGGGIHVLGTSSWELLAPSLDPLSLETQANAT